MTDGVHEPSVVAANDARRVEIHGRVIRADGRVEDLGLLAGRDADGTAMTPTARPVGVEHRAAVAWVTDVLRDGLEEPVTRARRIVDELFRYGPILPDGAAGARTSLTWKEPS